MNKLMTAVMTALLLVGCASHKQGGEPSVFEGRFIGYSGEFVEFFYIGDDGEYLEVPINVAEDGTFRDTVNLGADYYDVALFADKFMFRICFEQGKHYLAEFDLTTGSETDFRFFGEGEKENIFLSHYWSTFCDLENIVKSCASSKSFEEYLANIEKVSSPLEEELHSIDNRGFVKYYEADINRLKASYQNYYSLLRINESGIYDPEKSYLNSLKLTHELSDEGFKKMITIFSSYAPFLYPDINLSEAMKAIADFGNNNQRKEYAVAALIKAYVDAGCNDRLRDAYEQYKKMVSKPDSALCAQIENALRIGRGVMAPEVEFEDVDGKKYNLSAFRGKPLYIDLWASWCRPCCAEIPYLAKLVDELGSDPEIVCISISIDENRDDWTAKLSEGDESWPQFIATAVGQKAISEDYGVNGIPRCLLLDAEGKIVSVNAPRPSSPDIRETLVEMLKL